MNRGEQTPRLVRTLSASLTTCLLFGGAPTATAASPTPTASAGQSSVVLLDGRGASSYTAERPLSLIPQRPLRVYVRLTNRGSASSLSVRSVRFQGSVLGLAFVSYETQVDLKAATGRTDIRSYRLGLAGVGRQATGLLPARIQLVDDKGRVIDTRNFVVRVHGSLWSAYGVLGLAVAALSVLLIAGAVAALVRGRQHRRRLQRGLTFAAPGAGAGAVVLFLLSAAAVVVPTPPAWIAFLAVGAVFGLAVGLVTPTPYRGGHEAAVSAPIRAGSGRGYSPLHAGEDAGLDVTMPESVLMNEPVGE